MKLFKLISLLRFRQVFERIFLKIDNDERQENAIHNNPKIVTCREQFFKL